MAVLTTSMDTALIFSSAQLPLKVTLMEYDRYESMKEKVPVVIFWNFKV